MTDKERRRIYTNWDGDLRADKNKSNDEIQGSFASLRMTTKTNNGKDVEQATAKA